MSPRTIDEILANEAIQPKRWWHLSFADDTGNRETGKFRGANVLFEHGFLAPAEPVAPTRDQSGRTGSCDQDSPGEGSTSRIPRPLACPRLMSAPCGTTP
jgi:hypothetical protein